MPDERTPGPLVRPMGTSFVPLATLRKHPSEDQHSEASGDGVRWAGNFRTDLLATQLHAWHQGGTDTAYSICTAIGAHPGGAPATYATSCQNASSKPAFSPVCLPATPSARARQQCRTVVSMRLKAGRAAAVAQHNPLRSLSLCCVFVLDGVHECKLRRQSRMHAFCWPSDSAGR